MEPACAATLPTERADPQDQTAAGAAPTRSGKLLSLVRGLIAFGNTLLKSLHSAASDLAPAEVAFAFGTINIALIIARITRGLHLATALEQRLLRGAGRLDHPPIRPAATDDKTRPRPTRPRKPVLTPEADDAALLARLPTAQDIAAQIRNRPIGAVLADICSDLGINANHPLWRELQLAVMRHGGTFRRVICTQLDRARPSRTMPPEMLSAGFMFGASGPVPTLATGTGPP